VQAPEPDAASPDAASPDAAFPAFPAAGPAAATRGWNCPDTGTCQSSIVENRFSSYILKLYYPLALSSANIYCRMHIYTSTTAHLPARVGRAARHLVAAAPLAGGVVVRKALHARGSGAGVNGFCLEFRVLRIVPRPPAL
jgi:hypothetical protein